MRNILNFFGSVSLSSALVLASLLFVAGALPACKEKKEEGPNPALLIPLLPKNGAAECSNNSGMVICVPKGLAR